MLSIAEIDERVQIVNAMNFDIAAAATIAAIWTTKFDMLFAAKANTAVSAIAAFYKNLGLIKKFHLEGSQNKHVKKGERLAIPLASTTVNDLKCVQVGDSTPT